MDHLLCDVMKNSIWYLCKRTRKKYGIACGISEWMRICAGVLSFVYICIAIGDPVSISRRMGCVLIYLFSPATFVCLSQARTQLAIQLGILHMHRQSPTKRKSTIRNNVVFFEPLRHRWLCWFPVTVVPLKVISYSWKNNW
jgi:hypothetical protein